MKKRRIRNHQNRLVLNKNYDKAEKLWIETFGVTSLIKEGRKNISLNEWVRKSDKSSKLLQDKVENEERNLLFFPRFIEKKNYNPLIISKISTRRKI